MVFGRGGEYRTPSGDLVTFDWNDRKSSLIPFKFGSKFTGKMRVKIPGTNSSLPVQEQPDAGPGPIIPLYEVRVMDGEEVKLLGFNLEGAKDYGYIVTSNGTEGYIHRDYLVCP